MLNLRGKVFRPKFITRADVKAHPTVLFVFGDNMKRVGMGGQAGAMRGEPNAIGIPTKYAPSMRDEDFFHDKVFEDNDVFHTILKEFQTLVNALAKGQNIAIPADGLGTGLSQLPTRAPVVNNWFKNMIEYLEGYSNGL